MSTVGHKSQKYDGYDVCTGMQEPGWILSFREYVCTLVMEVGLQELRVVDEIRKMAISTKLI